jgi:hypothetical protein
VTAASYRRRGDVLWRRSLDAVLCLPPGAAEPVTLASTGPEVWELVRCPHSLSELATELAARHSSDTETVTRDVRAVLDELVGLGLVEPVF